MRQISLSQDSGEVAVIETPKPIALDRGIVVRTAYSLVSSGTELSKLQLGAMPLWEKARQRPDQVAKVLETVRSEGPIAAVNKVRERLSAPQPLGYSLSGIVEAVGERCSAFGVGDRVSCGGGTANHAEYVSVPANLAVPVLEGVSLRDAAFATVGAIAMHGLRTGGVSLGDRVLVIGQGLLGQITTRLAVAAGAHVFGVDPKADRAQLAIESGADAAQTSLDQATAQAVRAWSGGRGADVVLITAGGGSNSPLVLAGDAARDRARVVVIGAVDLEIPREPYYHKELSLIVSRSYGPGRYDREFEEKGYAYPPGYVPWTERRNMEEVLAQIASGRLPMEGLVGLTLPFDRAPEGYEALSGEVEPPISIVFEYPHEPRGERLATSVVVERTPTRTVARTFEPRTLRVSVVGVGNFATATLLPAIAAVSGTTLVRAVATSPLKAEAVRSRWKFSAATTNPAEALSDTAADVVFIATRHESHANFAEAALRSNRAVFVEKPLAIDRQSLDRVATTLRATGGRLMAGFNRRFSPAIGWIVERLGVDRRGIRFLCRVNAGPLPQDHWILDPQIGGGRLRGEACHFIDLACYLAASEPVEVLARARDVRRGLAEAQDFGIEISFANESFAAIEYVSSGDPSLAKERFEIHRSGESIVLEDFLRAEGRRAGKVTRKTWASRDKGHRAEVRAFLEAVRTGGPTPIPEEESIRSTALTLACVRSMQEGRPLRSEEW